MVNSDVSNYEKWCRQWQERFLAMELQPIMERLPELREEGEYLTLFHFARKLGVNRKTGEISPMEDSLPVTCYERLNIYTLFGYVSPRASFRGDWVTFDKLRDTSAFYPAFRAGVTEPFARTFAGHTEKLKSAGAALGGLALPWSDAGCELHAFDCIPVRFLFWDGDDEFPAQGNVLFDAGATDFIHGESIVTIAALGLARLAEKAGLEPDRSALPVF